jgi:biopolymer transport protein ExbB
MVSETLSELQVLLAKGGGVMPPLCLCALVLWYALGYRWFLLRGGARLGARGVLQGLRAGRVRGRSVLEQAGTEGWRVLTRGPLGLRSHLDEVFGRHAAELGRFAAPIQVAVSIAPLLGLLGTVTGMIETFDALGDQELLSATGGGVAGGIAEALFSTEYGLMVAIPGLLAGKLLERRQAALELELARLKELLVLEHAREANS